MNAWMDVKQVMKFSPDGEDPPARKFHGDEGVIDAAGLARYQREHLGFVARLDIPLDNSRNLRRYAEHLRSLAEKLDFLSRRTDLSEFDCLLEARISVKMVREVFLELYPTNSRLLPPK
jgi:hypothetical protein